MTYSKSIQSISYVGDMYLDRWLSKRWQLIALLHTGFIVEYTLRVNASVAVVEMALLFGWSDDQRGYLLSSFYWGYAFGQIPAVMLTRYMQAKDLFVASIILASIFTILLPVAVEYSYSWALVIRTLTGLAESAAFPAAFQLYKHWVPSSEKTIMITCVMAGIYMGEILCFSVSGSLAGYSIIINGHEMGSWKAMFYVFGCIGLLWSPLWVVSVSERPQECVGISSQELDLLVKETSAGQEDIEGTKHQYQFLLSSFDDDELEGELELSNFSSREIDSGDEDSEHGEDHEDEVVNTDARVPWLTFFTTPASATLLLCYWTQNWIGFLILSELPTYFTEELGFSLQQAGYASMLPYIAQFFSTLCFGFVFQKLDENFGWKVRTIRQLAMHFCFFGSAVSLIICGFVSDGKIALGLMVIALTFYGACQSGTACNFLEISPRYSAEMNTLANLFAGLSGVASPLAVAGFTDRFQGLVGWRIVFFLTGFQCLISSLLWFMYQTSDVVPILNAPRKLGERCRSD